VRLKNTPQAIAWCALISVCGAPFLFGCVERTVWIPLSTLWVALGLVSTRIASAQDQPMAGIQRAMSRSLLPLHAFLLLQLVPLPPAILRMLSPGAYAAHFLPYPGDWAFRPLSVSPGASVEAWLYVTGLQGLAMCIQGIPESKRRIGAIALLASAAVLALEGLWQSRSAHPFLLYGSVPIHAPEGLAEATFGPYYNRNHFATITAMSAGLAAGLAATCFSEARQASRLLRDRVAFPSVVLFGGTVLLHLMACMASGSRSGALAGVAAVGVILLGAVGKRVFVLISTLGLAALILSGGAVLDRMMRLDITQSRVRPWMDMAQLLGFFPILGSGAGTFAAAYWPYQGLASYEFWQHAHNEYLEFAIEGGFVGLLVGFVSLRLLWTSLRFRAQLFTPSLGVLVAFAVQAALDFPIRVPANAAFFVTVLALATSLEQRDHDAG
jgi:putative inorganic carbon (HCO3(-)) transporter